ncbi:POP1-domain-containing protein [Trametes cingulata]|nr:POP1-domain-containing protein [Trametes cingulata]
MAPKRQNDSRQSDEITGRERKKQKTAMARTIAVQSAAGPSNASGSAVAGPSKSVRFDSMQGLPGALDVERFAEARAFEINAMHEAMENARSNSTQRAWQQLPRHLRRRAASHDVRRVPLRLRDKARAEMDPARRKALGRNMPQRSKKKQLPRTVQLLRRQKDKAWLETHIWHAKRMHMENIWGYRLAITPTEKSFRPSHRASIHGSILHDASYFATIELQGPEDILRAILDSCCDCQGPSPGAKRYLTGARVLETYLYRYAAYPHHLIAPATVLWRADAPTSGDIGNSVAPGNQGKNKDKGKEKASEHALSEPQQRKRVVWIRIHPAVTAEVHGTLRLAASSVLDSAKQGGRLAEVEMADLREQFNVFEIMGPKASQVIKGALKPVDDKREDFKKFWASLNKIQSAGSVPRGMVIGFTVHDPRLSFPPKNAKVEVGGGNTLSPASTVFPSAALAESQIWEEDTRVSLRKPRYKKKDIDQRRSNNLVPGTPLKAERKDDRIPVLLVQRSVENNAYAQSASASLPRSTTTTSLHGWTLIIPQGWGMPFFSSLTYTGTRVGGQRERQTQAFEAGCAYFPRDFPATEAYDQYAEDREAEDRETWQRKPPAKRPNYDKLGTRSPWRPDWNVVLGILSSDAPVEQRGEDLLDTQRHVAMGDASSRAPTSTSTADQEKKTQPWLLRGSDVPAIVADISSMLSPAAGLLLHVNQARAKRKLDPLDASVRAEDLMRTALVQVAISLCRRGCPGDLAVIYRIDDEEARKWCSAEARKKNGLSLLGDGPDEFELSQVAPSPDGIIGYVTTGSFSLSLGEGHAVGAIPLTQYLEISKQARRMRHESRLLVKVRNRDDNICRAATVELLY